MVRVRSENHWSSPWFSEIIATTATSNAGTAATVANIATMRTCRPAPACPCTRAWTSSVASVSTSAITESTSRPLMIQMMVQTSGVGSMSVAPVMIRNEPDETNTDSRTMIRPMVRMARRPALPNSNGRVLVGDGAGIDSGGASPVSVASCIQKPGCGRIVGQPRPVRFTLQDNCCQNVTPLTGARNNSPASVTPSMYFRNRRVLCARQCDVSADGPAEDYPWRRDCLTISIEWARIFLRSVLRLRPSRSAARIWLPPQALRAMAISGASTRSSTRW